MPRKTRNPVVDPMTALSVVLRSFVIIGIPGLNMALARGLRTAMSAMTAMLAYLRRFEKFLGSSGSFSLNAISCLVSG